jgi:hypothetical protein
MVMFFALGSLLGWISERIVTEYATYKEREVLAPYRKDEEDSSEPSAEGPRSKNTGANSTRQEAEPIGP